MPSFPEALTRRIAAAGAEDPRMANRAMSALWLAGGALVLGTLPLGSPVQPAALAAIGAVMLLVGVVLAVLPRASSGSEVTVVLLLGAVVVGALVHFDGSGMSAYALLYVWITVYGGAFAAARGLALLVAAIAAIHGAVLLRLGADDLATGVVVVAGASAVAGGWTFLLRRWIDGAIAERTADARRDALTGLPNRTGLREHAERTLAAQAGAPPRAAFMLLDLDDFKGVNDRLGHAAGDELLRIIAGRLSVLVDRDAGELVARLAGDEFAILLPDAADADALDMRARQVLSAVERTCPLEGEQVRVRGSVGVTPAMPGDGLDALLRRADLAMYAAKEQRCGFLLFRDDLHLAARGRRQVVAELEAALAHDELVVHYQPIVELGADRVVAMEALVRWVHPERGLVPPGDFIPIAEQSGLIVPIGRWVLREALRASAAWDPDVTLHVNLSPRQLLDPELVDTVAAALRDTGNPAERLVLEITESTVMHEPEACVERLDTMRELGVRFTIDDFGVGHSALAYLRRLPIDGLKVDRSFVADMQAEGRGRDLVAGVLTLARSLDLEVVAEGVERLDQRDLLCDLGCVRAQGFHFARPVPEAEVAELLRPRDRRGDRGGPQAPAERVPQRVARAPRYAYSAG